MDSSAQIAVTHLSCRMGSVLSLHHEEAAESKSWSLPILNVASYMPRIAGPQKPADLCIANAKVSLAILSETAGRPQLF